MSIMPIMQSHSSRQEFPLRLYAAAFMISLLTTVFSVWQSWQMHHRVEALSDKRAALVEDVGSIMLFDEVLTMSARMAASTGDFKYEKRYDQFDSELTREIEEVRALLPQAEIAQFVSETDKANDALVKMERQAFTLTHQGRRHEATALLISDEYLRLKKVYANGMEKTVKAANGVIEREDRFLDSLSFWLMAASAVSMLVLLATWAFAVRSARSWAAERREAEDLICKARDELEVRVEQRTKDLSDANIQLKYEIAERTVAEVKNQRLTRLYAALSQCNQAIVRCTNQDELFPQVCRDAVQFGGFKMVWIGLMDETNRRLVPVASYGDGVEYLQDIIVSVDADSQFGRGPGGISIREDQPSWCQDFLNDPMTASWHESGKRFGWVSSASLPLRRNGVIVGALALYSSEANAFDEETRRMLVEMALDISFALGNFAHEVERRQMEEALKNMALKFRTVFELSADAIMLSDEKGFFDCNEATLRMFGCSTRDEFIGKHPAELSPPTQPSGEDSISLAKEHIATAFRNGSDRFEWMHRRRNGVDFPAEVLLTAQELDGRPVIQGSVRDITERRQAEAKIAQQLKELSRWYNAMMGREIRTIELKREVNELLKQAGQPPRYPSSE